MVVVKEKLVVVDTQYHLGAFQLKGIKLEVISAQTS
jgi:hypothetical protein